jgi:hypothetical protein
VSEDLIEGEIVEVFDHLRIGLRRRRHLAGNRASWLRCAARVRRYRRCSFRRLSGVRVPAARRQLSGRSSAALLRGNDRLRS